MCVWGGGGGGHRCHAHRQASRQAGRPHIAHSYSVRIPDKEN